MDIIKITPGPWAWQKFGKEYSLTAQHGMREIILSSIHFKGEPISTIVMNKDGRLQAIDPNHPNARLLALAPDMLDALQECMITFSGGLNPRRGISDRDRWQATYFKINRILETLHPDGQAQKEETTQT